MMSSLDLNSCGTGIGYFYNGNISFYYPNHDYNRPEQNAEASIDRTIQDHSADWHDQNGGGVPHGGIMFYTEGGELLHSSGEGRDNIIYTVSAYNIDALMSGVNAWKEHWAQKKPYIGGEYSNPNYFQNLADAYGSNSFDPIVINGSVLGNKNMSWYMHAAAAISIMGEGAVYGNRGVPIYQQHTVVNYWNQHYTPRYFQKWW